MINSTVAVNSFLLAIIKHLYVVLLAFFLPIIPALIALFILTLIDTAIAIYVAYKLDEEITSGKLSRIFPKLIINNLVVCSMKLLSDYFIIPHGEVLVEVVLLLIAMIEIKSISESYFKLFGVNIWTKIRTIINRK